MTRLSRKITLVTGASRSIGREIGREYGSEGAPVTEKLGDERDTIRCPWHGWTYDVRTGEHTGDTEERVPTFDVVVEGGTGTSSPESAATGRL